MQAHMRSAHFGQWFEEMIFCLCLVQRTRKSERASLLLRRLERYQCMEKSVRGLKSRRLPLQ